MPNLGAALADVARNVDLPNFADLLTRHELVKEDDEKCTVYKGINRYYLDLLDDTSTVEIFFMQ